MTPEEAQAKAEAFNTKLEEAQEAIAKAATKEEIAAVKESIEGLKEEFKGLDKSEEINELKESLKAQGEALTAMKVNKPDASNGSIRESIKAALISNKEKLEDMKTNSSAKLSIAVKAVGSMTFGTNTTGNVGRVEREAGIVQVLRRTPSILDIVNVSPTNASVFEWVEKSGHEGGVAMVAEGTVKPQGDWDLSLYSQKPKKEAIIVTVSKEMLDDIDGMAQDIENEIYEQIRLFTEDITLGGDGTGNNIAGIDANATPYTAGAFLNTVAKANEFDAIRTAINQVELNNDFPTHVLMHPTDAAKMELVKDDTTSQYVLPPFASINGATIKGLPIRTSTAVTQGEAYVGNFNRFRVKVRENITFDMGYRGLQGDWEKNMVSFLGEQRLFAFIPANHYGSIVKLDLSAAKALLDPNVTDPV